MPNLLWFLYFFNLQILENSEEANSFKIRPWFDIMNNKFRNTFKNVKHDIYYLLLDITHAYYSH